MDLNSFRSSFEPHLFTYLDERITSCKLITDNVFITDLLGHMRQYLTGGKRIRPYVSFLTYKTSGGKNNEQVLKLLVGLELFHLFCLIHDDIMDNSTQRHHVASLHSYAESKLDGAYRRGNLPHHARSQAILVGDLILPWAINLFASSATFSRRQITSARNHFGVMMDQVILGQMIDIDLSSCKTADLQDVSQKMLLKTATYTFIQPMRIGNALAKNDSSLDSFCLQFGRALGLAFQIQDDLLDTKDSAVSGKTSFRDIAEGQHTLLTHHVMSHGTTGQKKILASAWGKPVSHHKAGELRQVFASSGATQAAEDAYHDHLTQARKILKTAKFSHDWPTYWEQLIDLLHSRQK